MFQYVWTQPAIELGLDLGSAQLVGCTCALPRMAVPVTNPPSACVDGPEWRIWNGKTDKRPSQSRNADVSCRPKYAIPVQRFVWRLTPRTVGKAMGSGGRCREFGRTALSPLLGGGGVVAPDVDQPLWTLRSST